MVANILSSAMKIIERERLLRDYTVCIILIFSRLKSQKYFYEK